MIWINIVRLVYVIFFLLAAVATLKDENYAIHIVSVFVGSLGLINPILWNKKVPIKNITYGRMMIFNILLFFLAVLLF